MRLTFAWVSAVLTLVAGAASAFAQPRQNVTSYLQQGYQIINSTIGGAYLVLILKKDAALVMCSVTIETGLTAACQPIK
jgi:hypothetical protein